MNWLKRLSPRSRRLLGTTTATYLARLCSALTLLITLPLARRQLDAEAFGLWLMLGSLVGFFAFADLGTGNGALNRINQAHAKDDRDGERRIVSATAMCTFGLALLLILGWSGYVACADDPLRFAGLISEAQRSEAMMAFSTFVVLTALNLPLGAVQKLQLGVQDGQWVGLMNAVAALLTGVALPLALFAGLGLRWLVLASLGMSVLVNLVGSVWWLARRGYLRAAWPQRAALAYVPQLLKDGLMFFTLQLCAAFAFQSDAFVIGIQLGQPAYGEYAAIQRIFLAVSTLVGAALIGLWAAFGDSLARGDRRWAQEILRRALLTSLLVVGTLGGVLAMSADLLAQYWLHMPAPSSALPWLLAAWITVEALGGVCGSFLNGAGLIRPQVIAAVAMASLAFAGKWWLVGHLGAQGAVVATLAAYLLISMPTLAWLLTQQFRNAVVSRS
jgi:O-antigen/teichoic acid export membrane protein